jgi:hypothetical protein
VASDPNPFSLFLNSGKEEAAVVQAPAFSLTKVMALVAPVVTGLTAYLTAAIKNEAFTTGQITTLIVGLMAFLAVTSAADVLARGIATSAHATASGRLRMLTFSSPIPGEVDTNGDGKTHMDVTVVAASDANPPELLCVHDNAVSWQPAIRVKLVTPTPIAGTAATNHHKRGVFRV